VKQVLLLGHSLQSVKDGMTMDVAHLHFTKFRDWLRLLRENIATTLNSLQLFVEAQWQTGQTQGLPSLVQPKLSNC